MCCSTAVGCCAARVLSAASPDVLGRADLGVLSDPAGVTYTPHKAGATMLRVTHNLERIRHKAWCHMTVQLHTHAIRTEQAHVSVKKASMLHGWPQLLPTILTSEFISSSTLTCSSPESIATVAEPDGIPEALLARAPAPTEAVPARPLSTSNPPSLQAVAALTAETDLLKEDTCWLLLGWPPAAELKMDRYRAAIDDCMGAAMFWSLKGPAVAVGPTSMLSGKEALPVRS